MLPSTRMISFGICLILLLVFPALGMSKGLDKLSEAQPGQASGEGGDGGKVKDPPDQSAGDQAPAEQPKGQSGDAGPPKTEVQIEKSATSKALAGRLALGTSFGWISGSRSTGKWSARGGMSDISLGYLVRTIGNGYDVTASYRYAPMSVSGNEDQRDYRGIWQAHYFGGKVTRPLKNVFVHTSLELGYVSTGVQNTDGLPEKSGVEAGGFSAVLGGGADVKVLDQVKIGPRLSLGIGSIRTIQFAGAASFAF